MSTDTEFWKKKASDEERLAQLQESLQALEDARTYHEKEREQSMRYYDKQREDQLFQQMIEQAKLKTHDLPPQLLQEITTDSSQWLADEQKRVADYRAADGTKEIAAGTLATFDKKAAEIVEKGNAYTAVPFLNQARQLAAEKYAAFEEKQASYDLKIQEKTAHGDLMAAQVLEARKTYEAAAYERDTAQSVLAKYQVLYGVDSKNYREQQADVDKLTAEADDLFAKLDAVAAADADLRKALEEQEADDEAAKEKAFEDGWQEFQSNEIQPPTTEADDAEARADEVLRAMDEGRDPYADGYDDFEAQEAAAEAALDREMSGEVEDDHDSDGDAQIAEDRHLAAEIPQDLEFEDQEEDYDHEHEMTPVHRYEDRDADHADRSEAQSSLSERASLDLENMTSDERLQHFEARLDVTSEKISAAEQSGDYEALMAAQDEQLATVDEIDSYLSDRHQMNGHLDTMSHNAEIVASSDGKRSQQAEAEFSAAYSDVKDHVDTVRMSGKPWAKEMQNEVKATTDKIAASEAVKSEDERPLSSAIKDVDNGHASRREFRVDREDLNREMERQAQIEAEQRRQAAAEAQKAKTA